MVGTTVHSFLSAANATLHTLKPKLAWNGALYGLTMCGPESLLWTAALAHYAATLEAGDFLEAGVAKGGSSILMMSVLDERGSSKRHFACDSFQGLPLRHADAAGEDVAGPEGAILRAVGNSYQAAGRLRTQDRAGQRPLVEMTQEFDH